MKDIETGDSILDTHCVLLVACRLNYHSENYLKITKLLHFLLFYRINR